MKIWRWFALGIIALLVACSHEYKQIPAVPLIQLVEETASVTATPFQPAPIIDDQPVGVPMEQPAHTPTTVVETANLITLHIDASVPTFLRKELANNNLKIVGDVNEADLWWVQGGDCDNPVFAVYALVAPFPTIRDAATLSQLQSAWTTPQEEFNNQPLLIDEETYRVFAESWGETTASAITIVDSTLLVETAWEHGQYAIVPFHQLDARWKVIKIDGLSILNRELDNTDYPLSFAYCIESSGNADNFGEDSISLLQSSNRDVNKLTSITMTGVTALVRATAHKMESLGITYPGENIRDLLLAADYTHVSNEVAFSSTCPYPDPYQTDLRFCSAPKYIELFEDLDIDIIELTGNHIQDWSRDSFLDTLQMYSEGGYLYFGGGENLTEAKAPLLIEHSGNKIAFIGCNAVGPLNAWASDSFSGNAPCGDYSWLVQSVRELSAQGYLVIVTLQHNEFYGLMKTGPQERDFIPLAEAGAVIVSGSQAHYPNPFGFVGTHFIHYGLGNLFFDQMDAYVATGIQREFIDTHYFYDGRYVSTEIHTVYLENFAQPRMMTSEERIAFLEEAFKASGWR